MKLRLIVTIFPSNHNFSELEQSQRTKSEIFVFLIILPFFPTEHAQMREEDTTMAESKRTGVELRGSCSLSLHAVCMCVYVDVRVVCEGGVCVQV